MKTIWIAALAACAMSAASAQTPTPPLLQAAEVCSKMPAPKLPAFAGSAKFHVVTSVHGGRVVSVDIGTSDSKGLSRKDERAVKNAIVQTVQTYECKADGDYRAEQTLELSGS